MDGENEPEGREPQLMGAPAAASGKARRGLFAALFAAVALALAILVAAALLAGILAKAPADAVADAFARTDARLEKQRDKLYSELPMYQLLIPRREPRSTSFDVSLSSIDTGAEGLEGEMISAVAKLFSLEGDASCDPAAGLYELRCKLNMGSGMLLDFFAQLSPERLAMQVPEFSDTVLTVNPNALAEEIRDSRFYSPYIEDEIQRMQDHLAKRTALITVPVSLDVDKLRTDTRAILEGLLVNAVYEDAVKENGLKVYKVRLDGVQVRDTILALARYLHDDPDIGRLFPGSRAEKFLASMEKDLAELPATLVVKVGKNRLISDLEFTIDQEGFYTWRDSRYDGLTVHAAMPDGVESLTLDYLARGTRRDSPFHTSLHAASSYVQGVNTVNISTETDIGPRFALDMTLGKDGAAELKVKAGRDAYVAEAALRGTVTAEADALKWDFPSIGLALGSNSLYGEFSVGLKAHGEQTPLASPLQPVSDVTPFFAMTEDELTAELQKYYDGLNALLGDLAGTIKSFGSKNDVSAP